MAWIDIFTGYVRSLAHGQYHAAPAARADGYGGPLETDATGSLRVVGTVTASGTVTANQGAAGAAAWPVTTDAASAREYPLSAATVSYGPAPVTDVDSTPVAALPAGTYEAACLAPSSNLAVLWIAIGAVTVPAAGVAAAAGHIAILPSMVQRVTLAAGALHARMPAGLTASLALTRVA